MPKWVGSLVQRELISCDAEHIFNSEFFRGKLEARDMLRIRDFEAQPRHRVEAIPPYSTTPRKGASTTYGKAGANVSGARVRAGREFHGLWAKAVPPMFSKKGGRDESTMYHKFLSSIVHLRHLQL